MESAFPALIDIRTVIVMSFVILIAIRGYVEWEDVGGGIGLELGGDNFSQ